ncbi:MAG: ATP12 family chaperone protein [Rhodospirillaceae bacterium]
MTQPRDSLRVTADHVKGREPVRRIRRVYKIVSLGEADGKHHLLLDGKPARTPMKVVLETPHRALAQAVAAEWDAQVENIFPETMPMTRLLATAIDRIEPQREAVIAALMAHVHADLLCYRADQPPALALRQRAAWQPVLDWMEAAHGISFAVATGVMPQQQSPDAVSAMAAAIRALDVNRLTAFQACAAAAGSLALALALVHGRVTTDQVFAATNVDESFQMETWGDDELARERRDSIAKDIAAAGAFLRLVA